MGPGCGFESFAQNPKSVTSDDKVAAGVDVVLGLGGNVLLGDGGEHHFLHDVLPQSLQGDLLGVLAGNDNCVDPRRSIC